MGRMESSATKKKEETIGKDIRQVWKPKPNRRIRSVHQFFGMWKNQGISKGSI
jgi:hypothetical protein